MLQHFREKMVGVNLYADLGKQSLSFEPKAYFASRLQRISHVIEKRYDSIGREWIFQIQVVTRTLFALSFLSSGLFY
ncbi:hypothetical protein IMSAG049_01300 [Clostridiales bacterium]|nr:hypothetical protein IMSAG049_01300 [Clostridiales bacterium]